MNGTPWTMYVQFDYWTMDMNSPFILRNGHPANFPSMDSNLAFSYAMDNIAQPVYLATFSPPDYHLGQTTTDRGIN